MKSNLPSKTTIRRWIKELKAESVAENLIPYRNGMIASLNCLLNRWFSPIVLIRFGKKIK